MKLELTLQTLCSDLSIEPGEAINEVTEMSCFSALEDSYSMKIMREQEQKKERLPLWQWQ